MPQAPAPLCGLCLATGVEVGAPPAGGMPPAGGPSGRPIRGGEVMLRSQAGFPRRFPYQPEQLHGVPTPHVQGWGMGMTDTPAAARPILAIDVSKARLDGFDAATGETFSLDHTPSGHTALLRRAAAGGHLLALEASGGYERPLLAACPKAGLPTPLLHPPRAPAPRAGPPPPRPAPRRVRPFPRASGQWAKTDRLDARLIAAYAAAI